jgi:hypothetical protein
VVEHLPSKCEGLSSNSLRGVREAKGKERGRGKKKQRKQRRKGIFFI